ncbi:MAG: (2Fe-2S)-binding protein [Rubrivivax sp.]
MIVCLCRRISDRDIARAAREGCESYDDLQFELGVGLGCGCCQDCAKQTFEQHRRQQDGTQAANAACLPALVAAGGGSVPPRRRLIPIAAHADASSARVLAAA